MKLAVWSDIHMEFLDKAPLWPNPGADVLILSGDICVAEDLYRNPEFTIEDTPTMSRDWHGHDARRYRQFFSHVNREFDKVFYVMGNHEHYRGRYERTEEILRNELARFKNISLLENTKEVYNDVVFLGASIWTDFNKHDPLTIYNAKSIMNDYKSITTMSNGTWHKLSPQDTLRTHTKTVGWLKVMLEEDKRKTVVIGHHCPSTQSIGPKYASPNHYFMNGCFCSQLEWLMLDREHIALWTHGHVHDEFDYVIGNTRVLCNPLGYPSEQNNFDPAKIVEV